MEPKKEQAIIKTMVNQMAICGVTQGYLEIRGLSFTSIMHNSLEKFCRFRLFFSEKLPHFQIDVCYNEGKDTYEIDCLKFNSGGLYQNPIDRVLFNNDVYCEEFKEVFDEIFLRIAFNKLATPEEEKLIRLSN